MHLAHVTTLPFINPINSTVYSTTQYVHVNSYPKLDDTCDVFNTKGWVREVDVPLPTECKADSLHVKTSENVCFRQLFVSVRGELYIVYMNGSYFQVGG